MTDDQPEPFTVTDRRAGAEVYDAASIDGDPYDRPPARDPDTEFARVVDELREQYRPGVPDDVVPGVVADMSGVQVSPAEIREFADRMQAATGKPTWIVPPLAPAGAADAALVLYLAACHDCAQAQTNLGEGERQHMAVPFARESDRDKWAAAHRTDRGHRVALVEQHPATGSTITGYAEPEPVAVVGRAPYEPPLIAFVVRSGQDPDLLCTIPERAGAAWLLTAAHATLLGRGSLGVDQPHRVLYVGRISRTDDAPTWQVRIDGLLGATTRALFGDPIGMVCDVDARLSPSQIEDVCEALIARQCAIGRHLFSVVVMADPGPGDPPDEQAEAVLRAERLEQRAAAPGPKVDALREFVGPVAEVADVPPDR